MRAYYSIVLLLVTSLFYSQKSIIKGVIVDTKDGKPLTGVNIVLKALKLSTISDLDGNYSFANVQEGTYEIEFSFIGYETKIVADVLVKSPETSYLNISLVESKNVLNEVVITKTKAKAESVKSLLLMQKNSVSVSDGISAESIKKTPDKSTSDVLKRISGASIQDNKFVIVRGLNDRYNTAYINGAPLPSSEPDRKAFSFDIFPANMLDNLIISKTATPDLPGEFAGGIIQINTKSVPDKDFQSIAISGGYNTITTGKKQITYDGGKTDFLGIDDGSRNLASTIPDNLTFVGYNAMQKAEVAANSTSDWALKQKTFSPNIGFQYSLGSHVKFKEKSLGILVALTYNKTNNYNETIRNDYDQQPNNLPSILTKNYTDYNYAVQVLSGGLANFSFKFNGNNNLNFKNIYSLNTDDKVIERFGTPDLSTDNPLRVYSNVRWYVSNKIYSGQLNGEHYLPKSKIRISWVGSTSNVIRSTPNLKRNIYTKYDNYTDDSNPNPLDLVYQASIGNGNTGPDYGGNIFASNNNEKIYSFKLDIGKKFNLGEHSTNEVKIGVAKQERKRDFYSRTLGYNTYTTGGISFDYNLLYLTDADIFTPNNMGVLPSGLGGFTLYDGTKYFDSYNAASNLNSGYVMLDNSFHKVRLIWGVRLEDYTQKLNSQLTRYTELNLDNKQKDYLPSFNFIYSINKLQNLRVSYSKTLNRPEFRELAPFAFYDFQTQFVTSGNPELKIATIKNFDLRYEIYPGKGQLFSFTIFTKKFTNPIEIKAGINNKEITYENAASAKSSGIEIEFRTLLSTLISNSNDTSFLDKITLFSNFAAIYSNVDVSNLAASSDKEKNRPMQGQSPYVFNCGLQYLDNGWSVSTNLNRVGNRIYLVGNTEVEPTLWEKSRTFLDMQISKSLLKNKLELKLNIQNILAQNLIFYQNNDTIQQPDYAPVLGALIQKSNNSYNKNADDLVWSTKFGRTFSLSLSYNF